MLKENMEISYLDRLSEEWNKENEIVIWGLGMVARRTIQKISEDFTIPFIIDNGAEKDRKNLESIPVMTFDDAKQKYDLSKYKIVVATTARWYQEIRKSLEKIGLKEFVNFCNIEQFIPEWYWKNKNKAYILRADTVVSTKCTLNCMNCNMFIPYYKESQNVTFSEIRQNADLIFSNIDFIFSYILIGGEPFLNPEIGKIIDYIFKNYAKQIGRMEIVTNGTITLTEDTLKILKKYSVELSISDYTAEVKYKEKLDEFIIDLDKNGIKYFLNKALSWCDFGFPKAPFVFADGEETMTHMQNCSPMFLGINDGRMYYCNVAWSAMKSKMFKSDKEQSFDLRAESEDSIEKKHQLLEYSLGNIPNGYLEFCKVCGGCGSDNQRFVKAGCQLY